MSTSIAFDPIEQLAHHGKSFYWASHFLNPTQKVDAAMLYAFCRYLDDAVDEAQTLEQAQGHVKYIQQCIETQESELPAVSAIITLIKKGKANRVVVNQLIDGVALDLKLKTIQNEEALIRYCYGVASTVGLLMCQVLGVKDKLAWRYAIDLGISMQMTNMARDVLEDARQDRIYLPQSWFDRPIHVQDIKDKQFQKSIHARINKLLTLANTYYRSADQGLCYLPRRARLSILIASRVYEAIGTKILKYGQEKYWKTDRVHTKTYEKGLITIKSMGSFIYDKKLKSSYQGKPHDNKLHEAIKDLIEDAFA